MRLDMADVKVSVLSWIIVGLMATTFILMAKFLTTRYHVKGLSELMASV